MGISFDLHRSVRYLLGDGRGSILLTVGGGGFLTVGAQMIYPVMLPHLRGAYGLDLTTGGMLLTVIFVTNSLFQFPSGLVSDAVGERYLMAGSSLFCAGSIVGVIGGQSVMTLFGATALLGVGISAFTIGRMSLLPKAFPERVGTAVGVTFGAADAGQAILPAVAGVVAAGIVWQTGFAFTIPLFVLLGVASFYTLPRTDTQYLCLRTVREDMNIRASLREFTRQEIVTGSAIIFLFAALWMAFSGFYPEYLIQVKGITPTRSSLIFGGLFGLGMVIKPIAGALFDRYGIRTTISGLAFGTVTGLVMLAEAQGFVSVIIATLFISLYLGTGTIGMSMILDALPDEFTGTGIGILRTVTFSVAAIGPVIVGTLADHNYFGEAMLGLAVIPVIMLLVALQWGHPSRG